MSHICQSKKDWLVILRFHLMVKIIKLNLKSLKSLKKIIKKLKKKSKLVFNLQMKKMKMKLKFHKKKRMCNLIKNQYSKMIDKNKLLNINIILMINKLIDSKINWLISLVKSKKYKGLIKMLMMMIILILFPRKAFKIKLKLIWRTLIFLVSHYLKLIKVKLIWMKILKNRNKKKENSFQN